MWEQHWELPADIGAGLPTSYFQLAGKCKQSWEVKLILTLTEIVLIKEVWHIDVHLSVHTDPV